MHEHQLRFGLIAVKLGWISDVQLEQARTTWMAQRQQSLAEIIEGLGWISAPQVARIRHLLVRDFAENPNSDRVASGAAGDAELIEIEGKARVSKTERTTTTMTGTDECNLDDSAADFDFDFDSRLDGDGEDHGEIEHESSWRPAIPADSRYQLGRLYAEGGLSRVWIAHDSNLHRKVALKQIRIEHSENPKACRRFRNEAQITGQLEHPNIVPVYEFCPAGEKSAHYYTMRLVKGKTLRKACDEFHASLSAGIHRHLDRVRLLQAFVSVCQAIAYANSRGVIHRDIKPENIVLGKFGEVVVLDWGLAKTIGPAEEADDSHDSTSQNVILANNHSSEQTAEGVVLGTPAYMAPEQARPELGSVDDRTDVNGLGSTLFVILTGVPPHQGKSVKATLEHVATLPVRRARDVSRFVPLALDAICAKATAFHPRDRYANAADIASDVQRYLADEPISVYEDTSLTKARRWIERNRVKFLIGMSILPMITLALAVWCLLLQWQLGELVTKRLGTGHQVRSVDNRNGTPPRPME